MQCLYIIDYLIGNRNAPANRGSGRRRGQRPPRYSNTQSQQNSSQFSQGNSQSLASQVMVHPHVYLPGNFLSKICTEDRYCYLNLHVCTFTNSCNNVALPYVTFGYLPGEGYISVGSLLWRKNMLMHYLVFPMIFTLCYP